MGVKNAASIIPKSIEPREMLKLNENQWLLVDLLGSFFHVFQSFTDVQVAWRIILSYFPLEVLSRTIFVLDGSPTEEKHSTNEDRRLKRETSLTTLQTFLNENVGNRRLSRSKKQKIRKLQRQCFYINSQRKVEIVEEGMIQITQRLNPMRPRQQDLPKIEDVASCPLEEIKPVVQAPGEADLALVRLAKQYQDVSFVILTKDSDLLFHTGRHTVFLLNSRVRSLYGRWIEPRQLAIQNDIRMEDLSIIAATSGNDYTPGIQGIGIKTSIQTVKTLHTSNMEISIENFLHSSNSEISNSELRKLRLAYGVFENQHETILENEPVPIDTFADAEQHLHRFHDTRRRNADIERNDNEICNRTFNPFSLLERDTIKVIDCGEREITIPINDVQYRPRPHRPKSEKRKTVPFDHAAKRQCRTTARTKKKVTRESSEQTKIKKEKQKTLKQIALTVGNLKNHMEKSTRHFNVDLIANEQYLDAIRYAVDVINHAKVISQLATRALLLTHPRMTELYYITHAEGSGGSNYWNKLMNIALNGGRGDFQDSKKLVQTQVGQASMIPADFHSQTFTNNKRNEYIAWLAWHCLFGIANNNIPACHTRKKVKLYNIVSEVAREYVIHTYIYYFVLIMITFILGWIRVSLI